MVAHKYRGTSDYKAVRTWTENRNRSHLNKFNDNKIDAHRSNVELERVQRRQINFQTACTNDEKIVAEHSAAQRDGKILRRPVTNYRGQL